MIIVKLIGGLGNQMFQYAAGKALALRHQTNLKVDTIELNSDPEGKYTKRHFELHLFNTTVLPASKDEIVLFENLDNTKFKRELQRRFPFLFKYLKAVESGSPYHQEFEKYPVNTYLSGFWQSELYFKRYEKEIRQDFSFNQNVVEANQELASEIITQQAVSLHVRRGDYVSNANAHSFHGICSMEYYDRAVNTITTKHPDVALFVFSDDLDWCKANLKYNLPITFVKTDNAHSDMYLMSLCKHNIIANSSFSWWGAWLNAYANKIVIAPKQWLADPNVNTKDIIPQSWIKL